MRPISTHLRECKHGTFILLDSDMISQCMDLYGEWAEREVTLFQEILDAGDVVLDVGSHIGTLAIPIAKIIGQDGLLCCFEPQRVLYHILCGNLALNNLTNVIAHHAAVGEHSGDIQLVSPDYSQAGNFGAYSVPSNTSDQGTEWTPVVAIDRVLSTLKIDSVRLIKIDVEGMEPAAIRGARETIQRFKPLLFLENNYWATPEACELGDDLFRWIESQGYTCFWYCCKGFNPNNYFGIAENKIGNFGDINVLALPADEAVPAGLQPFTSCREVADGVVPWTN